MGNLLIFILLFGLLLFDCDDDDDDGDGGSRVLVLDAANNDRHVVRGFVT